jgi:hypothetical protein
MPHPSDPYLRDIRDSFDMVRRMLDFIDDSRVNPVEESTK